MDLTKLRAYWERLKRREELVIICGMVVWSKRTGMYDSVYCDEDTERELVVAQSLPLCRLAQMYAK